MTTNAITDFTRRDFFDHLRISGISWCGQKTESDFLERVFMRIPTQSSRRFRRKPAGDSDGSQPVIPTEASQ